MKKRKSLIAIGIIVLLGCAVLIWRQASHPETAFVPDYPQIDLTSILEKERWSEEDYQTLLRQTGLGKPAVDALKKETIAQYQSLFFLGPEVTCEKIGIVTREDRIAEAKQRVSLAQIQDGDILVTLSTHTLGWNHGHAGLVTDAEKGSVLEAAILGSDSQIVNISHWPRYSNFMVLRLKDASKEQRKAVADFGSKHLDDIPYRLTSGIFGEKAPPADSDIGAQCAYLVWYAYIKCGYDLDADGGKVVTVKDLMESEELERIQIYGFDPRT